MRGSGRNATNAILHGSTIDLLNTSRAGFDRGNEELWMWRQELLQFFWEISCWEYMPVVGRNHWIRQISYQGSWHSHLDAFWLSLGPGNFSQTWVQCHLVPCHNHLVLRQVIGWPTGPWQVLSGAQPCLCTARPCPSHMCPARLGKIGESRPSMKFPDF